MKAVILARVSSKEQEEGHSLAAQIANLKQYAERKSFIIVREFTIIESSTRGDRPEFMRMINFVKQQNGRMAIIADTVDRLQRSFKETPILNSLMDRDKLELHFVKEGNILSREANSTQKLMWNMGVVMAQSYTDQLSDNVKRSIRHKTRNGEWVAAAPLGYLNVRDPQGKSDIIIDPVRGHVVARIFETYATGAHSLSEMITKATQWGLRTKKDKLLGKSHLHRMITNPFYAGTMVIKNENVIHKYPHLISKNTFDMCQDVLKGKRVKKVYTSKKPYIFRGLITCGVSGRS